MKKYFVHYYQDFCNTYNLYYTDEKFPFELLPKGVEQITRKEAETLARMERSRRRWEPSSAYRAAANIYPAGYDGDILNDRKFILNGCIWEHI